MFIKYQGTRVKPLAKGKLTTSMGDITSKFQPYHTDMTTQDADEITDDHITNLVGSASMTRVNVIDKQQANKIMDENRRKEQALSHNRQYTSGMNQEPTAVSSPSVSSPTVQRTVTPKKTEVSQVKSPPTQSKDVTFVNEQWISSGINDVRNDNSETNWALVQSNAGQIELVDVGNGGVEELRSRMSTDGVYYGIVRIIQQIDNSITTKFAFVHYIGPDVKPTARAKISTHKGTVSKIFQPYHVELVTSDLDELNSDGLWQLITAASGTRSNVLDKEGSRHTANTQTTPNRASVRTNTGNTGGLEFKNADSLRDVIQDVRNDGTATNWMLLSYDGDSKTVLDLVGSGTGGADELASLIKDNKVYYGLVRSEEVIDQSTTVKFAYVILTFFSLLDLYIIWVIELQPC